MVVTRRKNSHYRSAIYVKHLWLLYQRDGFSSQGLWFMLDTPELIMECHPLIGIFPCGLELIPDFTSRAGGGDKNCGRDVAGGFWSIPCAGDY